MEIEIDGSQGKILGYLSQGTAKVKHASQGHQVLVLNFGIPIAKPVSDTDLFHRELVERISNQSGWTVLSILCSGVDGSSGRFSPKAWCDDTEAAVQYLVSNGQARSVLLAGYDLACAICLYVAARSEVVRGVATISPIVDLGEYVANPRLVLDRARAVGVKVPSKPAELDSWSREFEDLDPAKSAELMGSKQWLVVHGRDDDVVTDAQLKEFLSVSGVTAEAHSLTAGDHQLVADPRMMAILLGWMERIR